MIDMKYILQTGSNDYMLDTSAIDHNAQLVLCFLGAFPCEVVLTKASELGPFLSLEECVDMYLSMFEFTCSKNKAFSNATPYPLALSP